MTDFLSPVVRQQAWDLGAVAPGAVLKFYLSGTSTPQAVFTPAGVSLGTSLTADSTGRFAAFALAPVAYRMEMLASDGSTIWGPHDNILNPAEGAPGGSNGQVQYNDGGDFGGDSGLTYNDVTNALTVGGALSAGGALSTGGLLDISSGAAGQIKFPATRNPSSNPNTLDDYQRASSFTAIIGGAGGTSGQSYASQIGSYIKIGQLVVATGTLVLTAKGTITGNVEIQGLPFTAENVANVNWAASNLRYAGLATNWVQVGGQVSANTNVITLTGATAAGTANNTPLVAADISDTTRINFTVYYKATA